MRSNYSILFTFFALVSFQAFSSCSDEQKPPSGKPENFNINEHLSRFSRGGKAALRLPLGGLPVRASIMASMFAPRRAYDLKFNSNYMGSQEFGNWFYGAAAAQMGFTEREALIAGAVVQQWQNYNNDGHRDADDVGMLASNIISAIRTGEGDNLDDPALISGGYSYSNDIFDNDPNAHLRPDSCVENPSGTSSGTSSGGGSSNLWQASWGGGWSSNGLLLGAGCYGNCGGGGSGTVTITDFPYVVLPQ